MKLIRRAYGAWTSIDLSADFFVDLLAHWAPFHLDSDCHVWHLRRLWHHRHLVLDRSSMVVRDALDRLCDLQFLLHWRPY